MELDDIGSTISSADSVGVSGAALSPEGNFKGGELLRQDKNTETAPIKTTKSSPAETELYRL
jgi:hypothetical protein